MPNFINQGNINNVNNPNNNLNNNVNINNPNNNFFNININLPFTQLPFSGHSDLRTVLTRRRNEIDQDSFNELITTVTVNSLDI